MESRVQRYSRKNRLKRRIKRNLKALPKNVVMSIIYILVAFVYIIYAIVKFFDNLIAKLFMMKFFFERSSNIENFRAFIP